TVGISLQVEPPLLRYLAGVSDGILEHGTPLPVDSRRRALHRELLCVAVHLLQQRAAHAEGDVLGRKSGAFETLEDLPDARLIDAVPLDQPDVVQYLETPLIQLAAEGAVGELRALLHDLCRVSGIRSNDQGGAGVDHLLLETAAPDLRDGSED